LTTLRVEGERRAENICILNSTTGEYEPIDFEKTYTLASHNYLLLEQGGGASMFKEVKVISNDGMLDVELLEIYITDYLDGVIGQEYSQAQNRVNIVSDETVLGDANKDGVLNVRDCAYIAFMLAQSKGSELPAESDYNTDETIDVRDASAIAVFLALHSLKSE